MSNLHPDRLPEDYTDFTRWSDEDYDDLFVGDEPRQRVITRKPDNPTCAHCEPGRELVPDGYGEWVHDDNNRYSCDLDPRTKSLLFATPVIR
jgi:hypothetical protein